MHVTEFTLARCEQTNLFPWERRAPNRKPQSVARFFSAYRELIEGGRLNFFETAKRHGLNARWFRSYCYKWSNYLTTGNQYGIKLPDEQEP